jgi:hypothetical protein
MSRLRTRIERALMAEEQRAVVDRALAGGKHVGARSAPGDPRRLRGIPAIGPNCPGAIPGTRPDTRRPR